MKLSKRQISIIVKESGLPEKEVKDLIHKKYWVREGDAIVAYCACGLCENCLEGNTIYICSYPHISNSEKFILGYRR